MPDDTQRLRVTVSEGQVKALESLLSPATLRQAIYQATKRTVDRGARIIADEIAKDTLIERKYVDRAVKSSTFTTQGGNARGQIVISRRSIPLVGFPYTSGPEGVSVTMTRSRGPLLLAHGFMARVKTNGGNHLGVFTRKPGRDKYGRLNPAGYARRLPIAEARGISVITAFGADKVTVTGERILLRLQTTLKENLQSQLDRFLNQTKGQGVQLDSLSV